MNYRIVALVLCVLTLCAPAPVMAEQPLVQDGKTSVFQRVVSHPGAKLYSDPSAGTVVGSPRTFTSYYVYGREGDMLRVGVSATGADGWLKLSESTNWPQAITMVFTDQMGRQPVLFLRDHEAILKLCSADSIKDTVAEYLELFSTPGAHKPADLPVIATEPLEKDGQVSQSDFYLLPVLDMDTQFAEIGTQLLQVACIDPGVQKASRPSGIIEERKGSDGMTTGIVFVIDTTKSMKPYIDETREIVRAVYDKLQSSPARDKVAMAVVAFRSNVEKRPATEYNTLVVSDFTTVENRDSLETMLQKLEECQASTHDFDEDSLAGVKEAVDALSWDKIDAKTMFLITDAGPLDGSDPTSKTGMSPEGMADYLRKNNIFLTAVHIRTPLGKKDHEYAERAYRQLSLLSNNRSSYIPIDAPTPAEGAKRFESVARLIADTYCAIAEKQLAGGKLQKPKTQDVDKNASAEEQARHTAAAIGYAMQLKFVGDNRGTTAPQVVSAWIADADLTSLEQNVNAAPVPAVYPAVLLTKLQLSQLRKQLKLIITTAEEAFLQDSENFNFYEQLMSAAAQMSRDPASFNKDPGVNLARKGVLPEVLDGLPYKSHVLNLTQEDWTDMSTGQQQEFIRRLKGLIRLYEEYDRDNVHWEGFGSANANEWVYRVPLSRLP